MEMSKKTRERSIHGQSQVLHGRSYVVALVKVAKGSLLDSDMADQLVVDLEVCSRTKLKEGDQATVRYLLQKFVICGL